MFFTSRMATAPRISRRQVQRIDPTMKNMMSVLESHNGGIGANTSDGSAPITSAAQNSDRASHPGVASLD